MKILYHPVLAVIICTLFFNTAQAQQGAVCDTINLPVDPGWDRMTETANDQGDFVNGTNHYGDFQKANFFDLSATASAYLIRTFIAFGNANSSVAGDLSKKIFFRVYADNAGQPGALLATEERTLSQVKKNAETGALTKIDFTDPVALPASKKFYVSVDISNFSYPDDSIWIAGTKDSTVLPNQAWEQWSTDSSWHPFTDHNTWGTAVVLWIFPAVSTTATGCDAVLPVKLISFNAQRNNKDVTLNWQIADEFGMKGYEVERSDNNGSFSPVATVAAVNNAKNQSYSATDKNAFTISSTVQYRLKQIDGDGGVDYSRVISIKSASSISDISFANPFNGALKMQLNLATAQPVSVYLYDMQGKLVATEKTKMYNAASNTIIMPSTASLQRGVYVLKVIAGTDQAVYKIVKQ
ncbi:MAG TPA: T9SS type A sorting domain-containing protein [Chitinophagaceae bacterium]